MNVEAKQQLEEAQKKSLESQRICAWCNKSFSTVEEIVDHLYIEQSTDRYGYLVENSITSD